ncbi:MAG: DUF4115 domain-containing protein [Gammaproteobacteria bacterium]|nr:DUF4115 domain-containing protein [Gammaproteobacteria bacterium]
MPDNAESTVDQESAGETEQRLDPIIEVGQRLKRQREKLNISALDIARELKITLHYVEDIERGRLDNLPNKVYVRGYVASYIAYVGLDRDELLALFDSGSVVSKRPNVVNSLEDISLLDRGDKFKRFLESNTPKMLTALIIVTILVISGVIWYVWQSGVVSESTLSTSVGEPSAEEPIEIFDPSDESTSIVTIDDFPELPDSTTYELVVEDERPTETDSSDQFVDESVLITSIDEAEVIDSTDSEPLSVIEIASEEPYIPPPAAAWRDSEPDIDLVDGPESLFSIATPENIREIPEESVGMVVVDEEEESTERVEVIADSEAIEVSDRAQRDLAAENRRKVQQARMDGLAVGTLLIELEGECWVEVTDRYDEKIYHDLHDGGETVLLNGVSPLQVTVGNVDVATVFFNGERVTLRGSSVSRVANVTLQ